MNESVEISSDHAERRYQDKVRRIDYLVHEAMRNSKIVLHLTERRDKIYIMFRGNLIQGGATHFQSGYQATLFDSTGSSQTMIVCMPN